MYKKIEHKMDSIVGPIKSEVVVCATPGVTMVTVGAMSDLRGADSTASLSIDDALDLITALQEAITTARQPATRAEILATLLDGIL